MKAGLAVRTSERREARMRIARLGPVAKTTALVCVLLGMIAVTIGLVAPPKAEAQNCSSKLVISSRIGVFSPVSTAPSGYYTLDGLDANYAWCGAYGSDPSPYDLRTITPGATMVKVTSFWPLQPPPLTLSGLINRRGVAMKKVPAPPCCLNSQIYESPWIPLDPTLSGTLNARLGTWDSTVYHTVDCFEHTEPPTTGSCGDR